MDRNNPLKAFIILAKVALRKESVDRNVCIIEKAITFNPPSLSARRAWIEILYYGDDLTYSDGRSPQGERG